MEADMATDAGKAASVMIVVTIKGRRFELGKAEAEGLHDELGRMLGRYWCPQFPDIAQQPVFPMPRGVTFAPAPSPLPNETICEGPERPVYGDPVDSVVAAMESRARCGD